MGHDPWCIALPSLGCSLRYPWVSAGIEARADDGYRAEIEQFRKRREAGLKAEDGWLSVVGLHWLRQGESKAGKRPWPATSCLPSEPRRPWSEDRPERGQGRLPRRRAVKMLRAAAGLSARERSARTRRGNRTCLNIDGIKLILLKRGSRYALRVKDSQSEARASFAGLRWFPVDESWKITAKFIPAPSKTKIIFDTIVGEQDVSKSPGYVVFERGGKTYKLQAASRARRIALAGLP